MGCDLLLQVDVSHCSLQIREYPADRGAENHLRMAVLYVTFQPCDWLIPMEDLVPRVIGEIVTRDPITSITPLLTIEEQVEGKSLKDVFERQ